MRTKMQSSRTERARPCPMVLPERITFIITLVQHLPRCRTASQWLNHNTSNRRNEIITAQPLEGAIISLLLILRLHLWAV